MAEIQDETARGEVVLGEALARLARVEHGAEEREVRLHPVGPVVLARRKAMALASSAGLPSALVLDFFAGFSSLAPGGDAG